MPFAILLSPAWWLAKWAGARALGVKVGDSRWGSSLLAAGVGVAVLALLVALGAWGVIRHDKRIARAATVACEAENRAAALEAENYAVRAALADRTRQYEASQTRLAASEAMRAATEMQMQEKLDEAARAPDADALVFSANDRWLQAAGRPAAATGGTEKPAGRR